MYSISEINTAYAVEATGSNQPSTTQGKAAGGPPPKDEKPKEDKATDYLPDLIFSI